MERAGIAQLKARLSYYLEKAKAGEEVLITDRGRPVAKLAPLGDRDTDIAPHLLAMERRGEVKIGSEKLPEDFWERPRPKVKKGHSVVQAVIDERREGR